MVGGDCGVCGVGGVGVRVGAATLMGSGCKTAASVAERSCAQGSFQDWLELLSFGDAGGSLRASIGS